MDNEIKECNVATCEYWATPNNCKKCENTCKYFGFGGCKLEMERCYKIDDCYYKQLLAEQAKNKKLVEALEKIANTPKDANARISGGKGIDKRLAMAKHYIAKTTVLIAQQALNEVNK